MSTEGPNEPTATPSDAVLVQLPSFEGPLDLLLHLIQKHELEILDIPVSFITERYLEYLRMMRVLSVDVASEYLVMAATLLLIKSRTLLPKDESDAGPEDDGIETDPREELVRRLLEYQKYKAAGGELAEREMLGRDIFGRGTNEVVREGPAPLAPGTSFELLDALRRVLERTKTTVEHQVVFDRISITDRIMELTERLKGGGRRPFDELFEADRTTFDVVITFLALLEMCKLRLARIDQAESMGPLFVELSMVDDRADERPGLASAKHRDEGDAAEDDPGEGEGAAEPSSDEASEADPGEHQGGADDTATDEASEPRIEGEEASEDE